MVEAVKSLAGDAPLAQTSKPRFECPSLHTCLLTLEDDSALTSILRNTSNNLVWNEPSFCHCYCGSKEEEREDIYYLLVNVKGSLFTWVCELVC